MEQRANTGYRQRGTVVGSSIEHPLVLDRVFSGHTTGRHSVDH